MVKSGCVVTEEVKTQFNKLKTKKIAGFLAKISDDGKNIVVIDESVMSLDDVHPYKTAVNSFPAGFSRYAIIDAKYHEADGKFTTKIVLILWAPDAAPVRQRMVVSASVESLKKELNITTAIELHEESDKHPDGLLQKLGKKAVTAFENEAYTFNESTGLYEVSECS